MNGFRKFLKNSGSFQASQASFLPLVLKRFEQAGWWLFSAVILGTSACSTEKATASFGTSLEISQSSCLPEKRLRDQRQAQVDEDEATGDERPKAEEATLIRGMDGPEIQALLSFNCAVGEVCAEEKRDKTVSSLDILFFPCQLISESVAKCTCMIDVQSPIDVGGVSRIRVLKQPLRRPGEPTERKIITEIEIGPE